MDNETANVILDLQLQDVEDLFNARKGKNKESEPSDADVALTIYSEELRMIKAILSDRRMACSISEAVQTDGPILTVARAEEVQSSEDRHMACQLGGVQSGSL